MLRIFPCCISDAAQFVAEYHRHNRKPVGGLFACAIEERRGESWERVGVGLASRPVARMTDATVFFEITRCCTTGAKNAPSMLYGALCTAGFALGYQCAVTYTREDEPGTSLRAANFARVRDVPADGWNRPARARGLTLFGEESDDVIGKVRWERWRSRSARPARGS